MNEQRIIMNRLLDKYEHSKHLTEPGVSNRRVMLKVEKKDLPEYAYEDAAVRDSYNEAAKALEKQHLVQLEWVKGRPVLSVIVLCLDRVMQCYALTERQHPRMRANRFIDAVSTGLQHVTVPWITAWKDAVCQSAGEQMKVPAFCKDDDTMLADLLCAFREYSALSGDITMRAFSSRCYSDTKYFERNIRDIFLKIARKYDPELALACDEAEMGEREQLAFLGIYARPEYYELAGNCSIRTNQGRICIGAAPCGLALPSTLVDFITEVDLTAVRCITFIENKTNYESTSVLGKARPQGAAPMQIRFWADIDTGGFRMFNRLQELIPSLTPMRMSGECVDLFHEHGLERSEEYLTSLHEDMETGKYPLFQDAIERILYHGVTIEQESFLNE